MVITDLHCHPPLASPSRPSPERSKTPRRKNVLGGIGAPTALHEGGQRTSRSAITVRGEMGALHDHGDRFIPARVQADLHASYCLLPDLDGNTGREPASRPKGRKKNTYAQGTDQDVRREQVNNTFAHLLQTEMFPTPITCPSSPVARTPHDQRQGRRPTTFPTARVSNVPVSSTLVSSAGTTPTHHHPPPAIPSEHEGVREVSPTSSLPPMPMHAPVTPTAGHGRAPGAGPSSAHHRAHQSQVALTSAYRSDASPPGRKSAFSPPPAAPIATPSTPTRKRLFNFQSSGARSIPSPRPAAGFRGHAAEDLEDMGHESYRLSPVGKESHRMLLSPRKGVRQIARTPFKVLDAPELADDFYLNLVSWSASNVLGVGLNSCIYIWSAQTSKVTKLCDVSSESDAQHSGSGAVTGLEWTNKGSILALGTNRGVVEIWDAEYCKKLRTMTGHTGRVGALAWNNAILSSGSRDRTILHRDTRVPDQFVRRLAGHHKQEICGLRWNAETDQLASGGNDNKLFVWGGLDSRPTWRFGEHRAAVKAIAWNPHQRGILASGGGTADKKIRFWNSLTGGLVSELDTGSQVCNLMWSRNSNEIVSTHGYSGGPVQNQIHIWRFPSMTQVATLTGHTYRVLYLAMSPDGQTIVTGAGDETLRFWNAFEKGPVEMKTGGVGLGVDMSHAGGLNNSYLRLR